MNYSACHSIIQAERCFRDGIVRRRSACFPEKSGVSGAEVFPIYLTSLSSKPTRIAFRSKRVWSRVQALVVMMLLICIPLAAARRSSSAVRRGPYRGCRAGYATPLSAGLRPQYRSRSGRVSGSLWFRHRCPHRRWPARGDYLRRFSAMAILHRAK